MGQLVNQNDKQRKDILYSASHKNLQCFFKNDCFSYQVSKPNIISSKKELNLNNKTTLIERIDINWLNSSPHTSLNPNEKSTDYDNYYINASWEQTQKIHSYRELVYDDLYDGIDLRWYLKDDNIKYDYEIDAGVDYKQIRFEVKGAKEIFINTAGQLVIKTQSNEIIEDKPLVYQNGKRLAASWVVNDNRVSFKIENVDPKYKLTIDPIVRVWGTYYGGYGWDEIHSCETDAEGNLYSLGRTSSAHNIATDGAHSTIIYDSTKSTLFLVKFNPDGQRIWGTYYGNLTRFGDLTVKGDYLYITGEAYDEKETGSVSTAGAYQETFGGINDAIIAKFDLSGNRIWGTYFGGVAAEYGEKILVDDNENIIIVGVAYDSLSKSVLTTPGAHQPSYGGGERDVFIAKFSSEGQRLWGTYLGAEQRDYIQAACLDQSGNIYVGGLTYTENEDVFATPGAHQGFMSTVDWDGFVVKFNPSGQRIWGTFYGGEYYDEIEALVCDEENNVYLGGASKSLFRIATPGSFQENLVTDVTQVDGFIAKMDSTGKRIWSTYYGGGGTDEVKALAINYKQELIAAGITGAPKTDRVLSTPGAYQEIRNGEYDGFIVLFDKNGQRKWGTYYGGEDFEYLYDICVHDDELYVAGQTNSVNSTTIATANSHLATANIDMPDGSLFAADAFIAKFDIRDKTFNEADNFKVCIFPNTFSDYINISFYQELENCSVVITNSMGQVISQKEIGRISKGDEYKFDGRSWSDGIYFLRFVNFNLDKTFKIVKTE